MTARSFRSRAALMVVSMLTPLLVIGVLGTAVTAAAAPLPPDTGFNPTNSGVVKYLPFVPTAAARPGQVNAPLGQREADRLATVFGFNKAKAFSASQYARYLSGKGRPRGYTKAEARKAAQLTRLSVTYLTNTTGNTYTRVIDGKEVAINLGSYGLIVDLKGMLRVPANCPDPTSPDFSECSPVRLINWVLAPDAICDYPDLAKEIPAGVPCGYMGAWMRHNRARDTLKALYTSAYVREAPYASNSQEAAGIPQLIYVDRAERAQAVVGVPVAPAMWVTNYMLIYALSPEAAAKMPAYWEAIPPDVVGALEDSPNGQVPYADYIRRFSGG